MKTKPKKALIKMDHNSYLLNGPCVFIVTQYGETVYIDASCGSLIISAWDNAGEDENILLDATIKRDHRSLTETPSG